VPSLSAVRVRRPVCLHFALCKYHFPYITPLLMRPGTLSFGLIPFPSIIPTGGSGRGGRAVIPTESPPNTTRTGLCRNGKRDSRTTQPLYDPPSGFWRSHTLGVIKRVPPEYKRIFFGLGPSGRRVICSGDQNIGVMLPGRGVSCTESK